MKASEVIAALQELLDEHGDLDVRVEADHGQTAMTAEWVEETGIDEDDYITDVNPDSDIRVIVIKG